MNNIVFEISGKKIGIDYPPVVIAEIGINHEGSLTTAKTMVDAAKRAGCEIIKHQTHIIEDEMVLAAKHVIPGNAKESIYSIMERCSLSEDDERELQNYVIQQGMIFLSSPFSRAAVDRLIAMNVPAFKIGSGECNNYPLIELIAVQGKPIILSTGMNNIVSIKKAVSIIRKYKVPFALMHCTSIYPTPYNKIRFGAINDLKNEFSNVVIGFSDHSLSIYPCIGAVTYGVSLIEKHFTDHKNRIGPDIKVSMDEEELKQLIKATNIVWQCGGGSKDILVEEQPTINFAYACVVSICNIKKGEKLNYSNIWVKRPGTGEILAEEYNEICGKEALVDIPAGTQLKRVMFV